MQDERSVSGWVSGSSSFFPFLRGERPAGIIDASIEPGDICSFCYFYRDHAACFYFNYTQPNYKIEGYIGQTKMSI